ncbi:MraY family glycosyltransferase [Devosia chinhatensis]|uniref:Glycosyl transferase n=1 Tax=Devosia chinhatensis TaxID=429727 RepID=A0A0F5FJC9_9HYPH|nr:glycosyltransferase family 4 protein [Devosia chinhatensis]KKB08908.1 hypothetical protein VE26_02330 [Devosia chinhatensis]
MPSYVFSILVVLSAAGFAWLMAALVQRNAVRLRLVQVPNERSSHRTPTPSGGGIAIAMASLFAGLALLPSSFALAAWGASLVAALLGLADDRMDLPALFRLGVQFVLVMVLLGAAGNLPPLTISGLIVPQALLYVGLALAGVWWINLFNFMDGIDGIAASESVLLLAGLIFFALGSGQDSGAVWLMWWGAAVASASLGFLVLNWPPAKIFMGDAGSNFLATAIFAIALGLLSANILDYSVVLILAALFVADATVTLIQRAFRGERVFSAHRSHAYQRLARRWNGHLPVTLACIAVNLTWLYPLALWAQRDPAIAWLAVLMAYVPMVFICLIAGAGKPDSETHVATDLATHEE